LEQNWAARFSSAERAKDDAYAELLPVLSQMAAAVLAEAQKADTAAAALARASTQNKPNPAYLRTSGHQQRLVSVSGQRRLADGTHGPADISGLSRLV